MFVGCLRLGAEPLMILDEKRALRPPCHRLNRRNNFCEVQSMRHTVQFQLLLAEMASIGTHYPISGLETIYGHFVRPIAVMRTKKGSCFPES